MTIYGLAVFSLVYALAVASPGPGVAAVVARSLVRGTRGVPAFIAGFVIGDLVWFTVAVTGLAALAQTAGAVFAAIKYAGAAYLLYLAWRMWTTRAIGPSEGDDQPVEALGSEPTPPLADRDRIAIELPGDIPIQCPSAAASTIRQCNANA